MKPIAALGLVLALLPAAASGSPYYMRLATLALIYMAWTVAFNLIFGHTRQLFLCLNALAGTAGYVAVVLAMKGGLSPWLTVPVGAAAAAGLGALFSWVSVRRGLGVIFLGIVTLAFSLIFHNLVLGLRHLTNGETGLVTRGLGLPLLEQPVPSYYVFLAVLLASLLTYHFLMRSRSGMAFRALSDDELTAELSGIDVVAVNVKRLQSDNADPQRYRGRLADWERHVLAHGAEGWRSLVDPAQLPTHLAHASGEHRLMTNIAFKGKQLYITDSANGEILVADMPVAGKKMFSAR